MSSCRQQIQRCPNFTNREVIILLNLAKKYKSALYSASPREKENLWNKITKELCDTTGYHNRVASQVRLKFKTLKSDFMKRTSIKSSSSKSKNIHLNEVDVLLESIVKDHRLPASPSLCKTGSGNVLVSILIQDFHHILKLIFNRENNDRSLLMDMIVLNICVMKKDLEKRKIQ